MSEEAPRIRWSEGFALEAAGVTFEQAATQAATGVTHPDSSLEALLTVLLDGT